MKGNDEKDIKLYNIHKLVENELGKGKGKGRGRKPKNRGKSVPEIDKSYQNKIDKIRSKSISNSKFLILEPEKLS